MGDPAEPVVIERQQTGALPYREFETAPELCGYFSQAAKTKGSPKLSVAIMSHRNPESVKTCVECVLRFAEGVDYELVLMDNASEDGGETADFFRQVEHPRKKVIIMRDNMGSYFNAARGWTMLWSRCEGDYILHLNDDHFVTENAVQNMIKALDSDPSIGMVNPRSSNAWMMQDPWLAFGTREEMFEAAKAFNVYDPKKWEERIYVAAVAWMFRRELLGCMLCANPFGPEMCYDVAIRLAGYRVMLLGDTWVHHNHDYSKKESYGFTGETPEKIRQREYIAGATGHLSFGLKLFEDICVFEKELVSHISPARSQCPSLLAVDVKAGQGLLDLKNQLRAHGVFNSKSVAFSTQAKYYPLLYTMAEEVIVGDTEELENALEGKSFDYCIAGVPLNDYADPSRLLSFLFGKLKPGGELLYKLREDGDPSKILGQKAVMPEGVLK